MSMYDTLRAASKETFRNIVHEDGRRTLYFTDKQGREFYSLFGQRNQFQGTYPINRQMRPAELKKCVT